MLTPQEFANLYPIVLVLLVVGLIAIKFATSGGSSDVGKTRKGYKGGSYRGYNKTW